MTHYYRRDGRCVTTSSTTAGSVSSRVRSSGLMVLPSERRKNGTGISDEFPAWRSIAWNVAFLGFEACLIGWAHFVAGVSWSTIGAGLAAVVAFGIALITYAVKVHTPRAIRRHQELLESYRTAAPAARNLHCSGQQVRRAQPATQGPHEVVDRQSTPHPAARSFTAQPTDQVSRAR
jgi:hypothetical protein